MLKIYFDVKQSFGKLLCKFLLAALTRKSSYVLKVFFLLVNVSPNTTQQKHALNIK